MGEGESVELVLERLLADGLLAIRLKFAGFLCCFRFVEERRVQGRLEGVGLVDVFERAGSCRGERTGVGVGPEL